MKGLWPERRRRHAVRLDGTVSRSDGSQSETIVTDLSLDGCSLTGVFRIGECVIVTLPKIGTFPAEIRWAFVGRAGARFKSSSE